MSASTFRATCRKAVLVHANGKRVAVPRESVDAGIYRGAVVEACDLTFEGDLGVEALRAHMKTHGPRPTFKAPAPLKPYAWKAPRATAGGLDKVAEGIAAGRYDVVTVHAGGTYRETVAGGERVA